MIRELFVQNLALIEDVRVELQPGFCAWTGETGAGKSLLLGALGLLLGERGSSELIRTGADELRVTGLFELTGPGLRKQAEAALQQPLGDDQGILAGRLKRAGLYDEEGSVVEQVGKLQREAESWAKADKVLEEVAQRLGGIAAEVRDVAETLRDRSQAWEGDPERLDEVEKRLQLIRHLQTKY